MHKLDVQRFGIAFGITWALGSLLLGLSATLFGYGAGIVEQVSSVYVGYGATIGGALIGAVWGFVDAYIGGVIFAWIYNKLASSNNSQ